MMNSYEFDQPLDLRLKALNLSRAFHHDLSPCAQHHIYPTSHNLALVNNLMLGSCASGSGSCGNLLIANYCTNNNIINGNNSNISSSSNNNININIDQQQHAVQHGPPMRAESSAMPAVASAAGSSPVGCSILNPPPPPFCNQKRLAHPLGSPAAGSSTPPVSHHQGATASEPLDQHNGSVQGQQPAHSFHTATATNVSNNNNNNNNNNSNSNSNSNSNDNNHRQSPLNHHYQQQPHLLTRQLHPSPLIGGGAQSHSPLAPLATSQAMTHSSGISLSLAGSDSNSSSDMQAALSLSPLCHNQHLHRQNHHHHNHQHQQHHHQQQHHHHHQLSQTPVASSLQNLAHQNRASLKHRQLSPPLHSQQHQQHQHQHQQMYQSVAPVRSLSMSGQMLTPSHLSLMVSPTSTPPTSAADSCPPNASGPLTSHRHGLSPSTRTTTAATSPPNFCDTKTTTGRSFARANASCFTDATPTPNGSCSPPSAANQQQQPTVPNPNNQPNQPNQPNQGQQQVPSYSRSPNGSPKRLNEARATGGASSPIMRQHSLVSRYNCKPCGIVFSQPETLRAHQEGYCTKTNRAQLRSQSAVSPSTLQQTVALNDNNASGK